MHGPDIPTRHGHLARAGSQLYDALYGALRAGATLLCRTLFLIRPVGHAQAIPQGPLIVCANHASYLDPVFVQLALRRRLVFMMTNDFYRVPWIRWFFWAARAIPVASGRMAKDGLDQALAVLRAGGAVGIFPEGRLSPDGRLTSPQRGVSILARMGQAPVLTVGIDGNFRAWPQGSLRIRRANVRVAHGPLLPPPAVQPPPGRVEEQGFARSIMDGVAQAMAKARVTTTPARLDRTSTHRSDS